jgi:hypothetical protein
VLARIVVQIRCIVLLAQRYPIACVCAGLCVYMLLRAVRLAWLLTLQFSGVGGLSIPVLRSTRGMLKQWD